VVIHQTVSVDLDLPQPCQLREQGQEPLSTLVFQEDVPAGKTAVHDMVVCPWVFDAQRASHEVRLVDPISCVKS
jgi:hypothetical protein